MSDVTTDPVIRLGDLALKLGDVDRVTFHADGVTPESDTTHTVMLGLVACAFAHRYLPQLDIGLVAQYALVHDLVEAYAGDTPTLRTLTPEQKREKTRREKDACARIMLEFVNDLPWLAFSLNDYEQSARPEARYVHAMDKILPKITHLLNDCAGLYENGITPDELRKRFEVQIAELKEGTSSLEFLPLFDLYAELVAMVMEMFTAGYDKRQADKLAPGIPFYRPENTELARRMNMLYHQRFVADPLQYWLLTKAQFRQVTNGLVPLTFEGITSVRVYGLPIIIVELEEQSHLAGEG